MTYPINNVDLGIFPRAHISSRIKSQKIGCRNTVFYVYLRKFVILHITFTPFYATKDQCLSICQYRPCLVSKDYVFK